MQRSPASPTAAWLLASTLLLTSCARAYASSRPLSCPPSVLPDRVPVSCADSGTVTAGSEVVYTFLIEAKSAQAFDLVLALHTQAGDADLIVTNPAGHQTASTHGSGEDVIFIPRDQVAPGEYSVTVRGSSDQSPYKLVVEKHSRRRSLAAADRKALEQVLNSGCCSRPGSCTTLRNGLSLAAAAATRDLCNSGQNLCDVEGHLQHLAIVNEYLACPFPAALGQLSHLTLLDLTMNDITGDLAADVAPVVRKLPQLQNLLLGHNKLGGSITCELATPTLAELDLAANQLVGSIPPCLLDSPAIQELYLSNNDLSGSLPQPPAGSSLLIISAHSMRLSGSIPDMGALRQLQALQLHNNQLSGSLPAMPPSMRSLHLEYNSLSGSIPLQWGGLSELEVVRLRHNRLTGSLPAGLARQAKLSLLLLSDNELSGPLPADWQAPVLQRLDLQYNRFEGPLPAGLGSLSALNTLQANNNRLSGSLDAFVQAAAGHSELQLLALHANQLTGAVPPRMQELPLLAGGYAMLEGMAVPNSFDLGDNELSGPFPAWTVPALAGSNVVINLAGNRLACPAEVTTPVEVARNRMRGLECMAADGSRQSVAPLVRVVQQEQAGEDEDEGEPAAEASAAAVPEQPPAAGSSDADEGAAAGDGPGAGSSSSGGSSNSGSSSSGSSSSGGMTSWAVGLIAAASVAALAVVAAPPAYRRLQEARALRYQSCAPGSPSRSAAVAAKHQAVAMAELQCLTGKARSGSSSDGGGSSCSSAAAATPAAAAAAAAAEGPFQIGTRVHREEADMV